MRRHLLAFSHPVRSIISRLLVLMRTHRRSKVRGRFEDKLTSDQRLKINRNVEQRSVQSLTLVPRSEEINNLIIIND